MSVIFSPPLQSHVGQRALGGAALVFVGDLGRHRHVAGHRGDLLRAGAPGHDRRQLRRVEFDLAVEVRAVIGRQRLPIAPRVVPQLALRRLGPILDVRVGLLVRRDEAGLGAGLDRHVADRHAAFHRERADRFAGVFDRVAGAARGADLADDGEDDVLGGDVRRQLAVDRHAHVLRLDLHQRLRRQHVLDLGGADAIGQRAERAVGRGVAVAADQRHAGQRKALFRADDVADALTDIELVVVFEIEQLGVLGQVRDLVGALLSGLGLVRSDGRHVVIDDEQRLVRRVILRPVIAQAFERLRRGHLMDDMPVDVEQAGAVGLLVDQMVGPDLVVERARLHANVLSRTEWMRAAALARPVSGWLGKRGLDGRRSRPKKRPGRRTWIAPARSPGLWNHSTWHRYS